MGEQNLTFLLTHNRSLQRRDFPGNQLHCYVLPNSQQEGESTWHTQKRTPTQALWPLLKQQRYTKAKSKSTTVSCENCSCVCSCGCTCMCACVCMCTCTIQYRTTTTVLQPFIRDNLDEMAPDNRWQQQAVGGTTSNRWELAAQTARQLGRYGKWQTGAQNYAGPSWEHGRALQ